MQPRVTAEPAETIMNSIAIALALATLSASGAVADDLCACDKDVGKTVSATLDFEKTVPQIQTGQDAAPRTTGVVFFPKNRGVMAMCSIENSDAILRHVATWPSFSTIFVRGTITFSAPGVVHLSGCNLTPT
jgi:hypothetical protein